MRNARTGAVEEVAKNKFLKLFYKKTYKNSKVQILGFFRLLYKNL